MSITEEELARLEREVVGRRGHRPVGSTSEERLIREVRRLHRVHENVCHERDALDEEVAVLANRCGAGAREEAQRLLWRLDQLDERERALERREEAMARGERELPEAVSRWRKVSAAVVATVLAELRALDGANGMAFGVTPTVALILEWLRSAPLALSSGWISVRERLPPDGDLVLTIAKRRDRIVPAYMRGGFWHRYSGGNVEPALWHALPPLPGAPP